MTPSKHERQIRARHRAVTSPHWQQLTDVGALLAILDQEREDLARLEKAARQVLDSIILASLNGRTATVNSFCLDELRAALRPPNT